MLCDELRRYIAKSITRFGKPVSVEKQVAVTLYYLSDEGRMRKAANSFGLAKNTVSKIIRCVTKSISKHLVSKYIQLPSDYINRKGRYTLNCQAAAYHQYCFIDIVIKWLDCFLTHL